MVISSLKQTRTGRADLLELYLGGLPDLGTRALQLGFQWQLDAVPQTEAASQVETPPTPATEAPFLEPLANQDAPIPFWRQSSRTLSDPEGKWQDTPQWVKDASPIGPEQFMVPRDEKPPQKLWLSPWSRLWPFLKGVLSTQRPGNQPQLSKIIGKIARGEWLTEIPLKPVKTWAAECRVIIDRSPRLDFLLGDFQWLVKDLARLRGEEGLQAHFMKAGPLGPCGDWFNNRKHLQAYPVPNPGTPLLVLGDLGCLTGEDHQILAWVHFGRQLKRRGIQPRALAVCPSSQWDPRLSHEWEVTFWDRGLPLRPSVSSEGADEHLLNEFLVLLSPAVRIEPELLRELRLHLPSKFHVGLESEILTHPDILASGTALALRNEAVHSYRSAFKQLPQAQKRWVLDRIADHHRHHSPVIRLEEALISTDLLGEAVDIDQTLASITKDLLDGSGISLYLKAWLTRLSRRQRSSIWQRSDLSAAVYVSLEKDMPLPAGFDPARISWLLGGRGPLVTYALTQVGQHLEITTAHKLPQTGCLLARINARLPKLWIDGQPYSLLEPLRLPLNARQQSISVISDTESLCLETVVKPTWAAGIARGPSGLKVQLEEGHELTWPDWADSFGRDEYGVYADFSVGQVSQRMRYIKPGQFLMGSPKDEPQREDDEMQHPVTLTEGFWLADTGCSQAMWRVVLGNNPSIFEGEDRPVEYVGWHDVAGFLTQLNRRLPGLDLALPTEAQWEYACRAGTQTPFSFGTKLTSDLANFDGNHSYGVGEKGTFRGETVGVKSFEPNPWGLYQMHGNVYEWCADWYSEYTDRPVTDPSGPDSGEFRALRGGSWIIDSNGLRSAYRGRRDPSNRSWYIGFRVARGLNQKKPVA